MTTAPGLQFYTGNFLDGTSKGKGGAAYGKHAGLCLESQSFPNAVNMTTKFPSPVITPQDTYKHDVVWRFYTKSDPKSELVNARPLEMDGEDQ